MSKPKLKITFIDSDSENEIKETKINKELKDINNCKMDKIKGMLYALAIRDCCGIPFEFIRSKPKLEWTGLIYDVDITIPFRFHSTIMKAGSTSDDTEMSIALLNTIITHHSKQLKYHKGEVLLSYMRWANQSNMLGRNTRKLLKGIKTIKGYNNRVEKMGDEMKESQSNGSLMRASPLALLPDNILFTDTDITNPNDVNRYCTLIFVTILKMLLDGKSKIECKEYYISQIISNNLPKEVKESIQDSLEEKDTRNISGKNKGWVCNTFYIAFYTFWNYDSFEEAVEFVINQHPGSDTDTNCSICGALFGAWLGFEKLNLEPLTKQNITSMDNYWKNSTSEYKLTPDLFERLSKLI